MATAAKRFKKDVDEITECPVCIMECSEPKLLPCGHTLCLSCIEQIVDSDNKRPGDEIPCPICRNKFKIPRGGVQNLHANLLMNKLIERCKSAWQTIDENAPICDVCTEDAEKDPDTVAKWHCVNCGEKLCSRCSTMHRKQRATKAHQIVEIGDVQTEHLIKSTPSFCDQHSDEQSKLYCMDCHKVICLMCFALDHQGHNTTDLNTISEEFCKQLLKNQETLIGKRREIEDVMTNQRAEKDKLLECIRQNRIRILQRKIELDKQYRRIEDLQQQLYDIEHTKISEMEKCEDETNQQLIMLENFSKDVINLKDKASALDRCREAHKITSRTRDLQHLKPVRIIPSPEVNFTPANVDLTENVVGAIVTLESIVPRYYTYPPTKFTIQPLARPLCVPNQLPSIGAALDIQNQGHFEQFRFRAPVEDQTVSENVERTRMATRESHSKSCDLPCSDWHRYTRD